MECLPAVWDPRILYENYDSVKKWVDHQRSVSSNNLLGSYGYGDWLNWSDETPKDVFNSLFYARSTDILAKMASITGHTTDAQTYGDLFNAIKTSFDNVYVAADGYISANTQTAYALALAWDILPESKRAGAAFYLSQKVASKGNHPTIGFFGGEGLLVSLSNAGYLGDAYNIIMQESLPSIGFMINQGATTIWERWNSRNGSVFGDPGMNSFNHASLGSMAEWLYRCVAGIEVDPNNPGYKHSFIQPEPGGDLTSAKGEYTSVYGKIASDWNKAWAEYLLLMLLSLLILQHR